MLTILSSAGSNPSNSFQRWREALADRTVPIELTKNGEAPFNGTLEAADIGTLLITRSTQSAVRIAANRTRHRHNDDTLFVAIMLSGQQSLEQGGRASIQRAGDLVVMDHGPATVTIATDGAHATSRSLIVGIPRGRLEGMLGSAGLYTCLTIGATQASTSLFTTFFDDLIRVYQRLTPSTTEQMSSIGVDLLVASIAERLAQEIPKPLHGTIVLQRAKAYIEANLSNPTLTPPHLAAAMGVSLRRLQELFREHGRHISEWIWQRRLDVAAMRLADAGFHHLPINSLAYGCGFSSQAHFASRFKDRYGITPREYRHAARLNGIVVNSAANPRNDLTGFLDRAG